MKLMKYGFVVLYVMLCINQPSQGQNISQAIKMTDWAWEGGDWD